MHLDELLDRTGSEFLPQAECKGLALRVASTPCLVRTAPQLLERTLRNLVSNAVRYTEIVGSIGAFLASVR